MKFLFNQSKSRRFESIFDQYSRMLFLLALRYVSSEFDAEEVVQRGFIKLYKSIDRIEDMGEKAFKGYVCKVIVNESLLFLRERKRDTYQLITNQELEVCSEEVEEYPDYELCLKFVCELPEGYRVVFNLFAIENYSHQEIAQLLGITESASRSQLSRARAVLKSKIQKYRYHEEIAG